MRGRQRCGSPGSLANGCGGACGSAPGSPAARPRSLPAPQRRPIRTTLSAVRIAPPTARRSPRPNIAGRGVAGPVATARSGAEPQPSTGEDGRELSRLWPKYGHKRIGCKVERETCVNVRAFLQHPRRRLYGESGTLTPAHAGRRLAVQASQTLPCRVRSLRPRSPLTPKVRPSHDGRGVIVSEKAHPACPGRGTGGAGNKVSPPVVYQRLGSAVAP